MAATTVDSLTSISVFRAVTVGNDLAVLADPNGPKAIYPRGIYLSATADVVLVGEDGQSVTLTALAGGIWHPISPVRITSISTGTAVAGY